MAHFAKVARLADLPPGTGMMVVGPFDKPMALFNVGGEVFCQRGPHGQAGEVDDPKEGGKKRRHECGRGDPDAV